MAHNNAFFLIALLMFTTVKPLANAQLPANLLQSGVNNLSENLANVLAGLTLSSIKDLLTLINVLAVVGIAPITAVPKSFLPCIINLLQGLDISGMLCCTPTGNCPTAGGSPLSGAVVNLNCTSKLSGLSILGQGRTDINGRFNITENNITGKILNIVEELPCEISVLVNQLICPILSAEDGAVLTGVLTPLSLVLNQVQKQLTLSTQLQLPLI